MPAEEIEEKVVIEQRLLKLDEVFVYRIPPMRSADGHRAEDWNLAKPLQTCSLIVNRLDAALCINIMAERPKANAPPGATESYLFAQSTIKVGADDHKKLEHWVESVIDSSRYFAVRIRDSKTGREAFIGVGFRERNDATNFRMTMEDYCNDLRKEEKAQELHRQFEQSIEDQSCEKEDGVSEGQSSLPPVISNLSLKEGEKIHINIKGGGGSKRVTPAKSSKQTPKKGGLVGLRKPPPPPSPDVNSDATKEASSAENATNNGDEEEDEWGDFEG
ncbi:hypothetical protein ACHAWC_006691 [Mediolabrus comicus]